MKKLEQKPIVEVNVTVTNGQMMLNLHIPYKWLGIIIPSLILWRAPDLWKAIETVISLFGN